MIGKSSGISTLLVLRYPVKKPKDHLLMEGEFTKRVVEEVHKVGEKYPTVKPKDNLAPEGQFHVPPKPIAPKIERTKPITREDNLKPLEGAFPTRRIEDAPKLERAVVKIPKENLKPEGQHYYPAKPTAPAHGERHPVVRHPDNIAFKGDFPQRHVEPIPKLERTKPIMHDDNLKQTGQHYYPDKAAAPKMGDKYPTKRPVDNLIPEGEFSRRPKEELPKMGERFPISEFISEFQSKYV